MAKLVKIDGAQGEGGGQIVRTSLSLAALTGTSLRIERIRNGRKKPGLLRQHLTAVRALAEICDAEVEGAELGSPAISFHPRAPRPGEYHFSIGSAGSASLVFQTVLWPLVMAGGHSRVVLEGGTHNPFAPPVDFITRSFLPILATMGVEVTVELERYGFYPAGGGRFTVEIEPCEKLAPLELLDSGKIRGRQAVAIVANLPRSIAEREIKVVRKRLGWSETDCQAHIVTNSPGPGNVLMIEIEREHVTEIVSAFGERGVRAETVANRAAKAAKSYLSADVPVGVHLADQLIIPLALAGGGCFRTLPLSLHTRTNIDVTRRLLPVEIDVTEEADRSVLVAVRSR